MFITCSKPIYLCIHVCMIGNYIEILQSFQDKLKELGMQNFFSKIFIGILGKHENSSIQKVLNMFENVELLDFNENLGLYERLTLHKLYEKSLEHEFYVLYLHTKGVTHSPMDYSIHVWRNKMLFFLLQYTTLTLHQFEHDTADVVGIDFLTDSRKYPRHYSGNFWWTTSKHLKTLHLPIENDYLAPEMWICNNNHGRYISLYQTHRYNFYQGINSRNKDAIINDFSCNRLDSRFLKPSITELYLEDLLESKNHIFGNFPHWTNVENIFKTGIYEINQKFFKLKDDPYLGKIKFWVFQNENSGLLSCYIEHQKVIIRTKNVFVLHFNQISETFIYGNKTYRRDMLHFTPTMECIVSNNLFSGDDPDYGNLKTWNFRYNENEMSFVEQQKIMILV